MASEKIQFSAGVLEDDLKERTVWDERSPSLIAQRDLGRYYRLLRASLPQFSIQEARVLFDAIEPHTRAGGTGRPGSAEANPALLWAFVAQRKEYYAQQQAEDGALDTWWRKRGITPTDEHRRYQAGKPGRDVDIDVFVEHLRNLPPAEAQAIIDAVERVSPEYVDEDGNEEPDPRYMAYTYQELTRVGLVSAQDQAFEVLAEEYVLDGEWQQVYRVYERVGNPLRIQAEAEALAEALRAEERAKRPNTLARRRFRVVDVRDDWPERDSVAHSPRTLEPLILRTV